MKTLLKNFKKNKKISETWVANIYEQQQKVVEKQDSTKIKPKSKRKVCFFLILSLESFCKTNCWTCEMTSFPFALMPPLLKCSYTIVVVSKDSFKWFNNTDI